MKKKTKNNCEFGKSCKEKQSVCDICGDFEPIENKKKAKMKKIKWFKYKLQEGSFYAGIGERFLYNFETRKLTIRSGRGAYIASSFIVKNLKTAKQIAELLEL